jgi:probable HAF family extracellular repeat protein
VIYLSGGTVLEVTVVSNDGTLQIKLPPGYWSREGFFVGFSDPSGLVSVSFRSVEGVTNYSFDNVATAGTANQTAIEASTFTATLVPTLGGAVGIGFGINGSGQVAGWSTTVDDTARHAFIYSTGATIDLGSIGADGEVWSVNDRAEVTGSALAADGALHAFVYSGGQMRDLGTLGGRESLGFGINTHGQVVGYSWLPGNAVTRAFLYANGAMHALGTLGGGGSEAYGINARGEIVGTSHTANVTTHAFIFSGGVMRDLGTLPGGSNSYGFAISADGAVTGMAFAADGNLHAFVYSDGAMCDLGTLPGGTDSVGRGINARRQIVGTAGVRGVGHAFIHTAGRMYDLTGLVTSGLPPGVRLDGAFGINDSGQIVATAGLRAYRLDPVFPVAIEYRHGEFDDHFLTIDSDEMWKLDAGVLPGWVRTGESIPTYSVDTPGSTAFCRFWSGQTFGPRSSHFFTPVGGECAIVKRNRDWIFEGEVFSMLLPDFAGACAAGATPLYRLYNEGMGGVPHHRYTTNPAIRAEMLAQGWIAEGAGVGVIGCAPAY